MDILIPILLIIAVQLLVLYFIIQKATHSKTLVEQNEKIILALRTIAKTNGADLVQIYNLYSPENIIAHKTNEGSPSDPMVDVAVDALELYRDKLPNYYREGIQKAIAERKMYYRLPLSILTRITSK